MKYLIKSVILFTAIFFLVGCSRIIIYQDIDLKKSSFNQLSGWDKDNHKLALDTFRESCNFIKKIDKNYLYKQIPYGNCVSDWQNICSLLNDLGNYSNEEAKNFFESFFEPYHVLSKGNSFGLFTGYYLPKLECDLNCNNEYKFPIHAIPSDLVKIDLGLFDKASSGKYFIGQVKNNKLYRYPKRKLIVNYVNSNNKILAWCKDKIDIAFAHIQGSAMVSLPNNKQFLIGYDTSNGHPYKAIGQILVNKGNLHKDMVSMQNIKKWLLNNPDQIDNILDENDSYVFFQILKSDFPIGSQQTSLTPERSIAIDKKFIPFGVPIWLKTTIPKYETNQLEEFNHLLIAQDTGGAIKGAIRGDIYFGFGNRATFIAGNMKSKGEIWLLLPKNK